MFTLERNLYTELHTAKMENLVYQVLGIKKHKALTWSVIFSSFFLFSCSEIVKTTSSHVEIYGETQGTTYSIILAEKGVPITKKQIDSIFTAFDLSLSTYVEGSVISQINRSESNFNILDKNHFYRECYQLSQDIYSKTDGFFDPSVFPLVKGWGFMNHMDSPLSKNEVDSILTFVSFEKERFHQVEFKDDSIFFEKSNPNFKIDFNAIAQGQSVDVVADYLKSKGYSNFYVEVGGELKVSGFNREGVKWKIGIDSPKENLEHRELENILHLTNASIATSGNYRKFYVKDGVKYTHSLNPKTGFPVHHSLLSVTVIAEDCATADGYATSFMVMGKEATLSFVENHPEEKLEVYLLSAAENDSIDREMSVGFSQYLQE